MVKVLPQNIIWSGSKSAIELTITGLMGVLFGLCDDQEDIYDADIATETIEPQKNYIDCAVLVSL